MVHRKGKAGKKSSTSTCDDMKQLPLESESYQYLERSFKEWLDVLGYAASTVRSLPVHVREFFHYLEKAGKDRIQEMESKDFIKYYQQLKSRKNQRRGGGLSNGYLNKHRQALLKFMEYLRVSGKYELPILSLRSESNHGNIPHYLSQEEVQELYRVTYGFNEGSHLGLLNYRDRAMLSIFYGCGLRRSEGYYLDVGDVNFDRRILHVRKGKGNKERFVPFTKKDSEYTYKSMCTMGALRC